MFKQTMNKQTNAYINKQIHKCLCAFGARQIPVLKWDYKRVAQKKNVHFQILVRRAVIYRKQFLKLDIFFGPPFRH